MVNRADYQKIDSMVKAHFFVLRERSKEALDFFIAKYGFMAMPYRYYIEAFKGV